MLRGRDAVFNGAGQTNVVLFQKWSSALSLPASVSTFVRSSRSGHLRPLPVSLASLRLERVFAGRDQINALALVDF